MSETVDAHQSRITVPALFVAQNAVVLSNICFQYTAEVIGFVRWGRIPTVQVVQKTLEIPFVQDNVVGLFVVGQSRSRRCKECSKRWSFCSLRELSTSLCPEKQIPFFRNAKKTVELSKLLHF